MTGLELTPTTGTAVVHENLPQPLKPWILPQPHISYWGSQGSPQPTVLAARTLIPWHSSAQGPFIPLARD